jgi:hypothetical protein
MVSISMHLLIREENKGIVFAIIIFEDKGVILCMNNIYKWY